MHVLYNLHIISCFIIIIITVNGNYNMQNEVVYSNLGDINGGEFIVRMRQHIRPNEYMKLIHRLITCSSHVYQKCSSSIHFLKNQNQDKEKENDKDNHMREI